MVKCGWIDKSESAALKDTGGRCFAAGSALDDLELGCGVTGNNIGEGTAAGLDDGGDAVDAGVQIQARAASRKSVVQESENLVFGTAGADGNNFIVGNGNDIFGAHPAHIG